MTSDESLHPEVETMAAFIEGTLAPSDLGAVTQHLAQCEDCRTIVSETARFEREESPEHRMSRSKRWWLTAAAAIGGAVALTVPLAQRIATKTPVEMLAEAAPRDHRLIEPRLSGFEHARYTPAQRGTQVRQFSDLQFQGVAGDVLEETTGQTKPAARHGAGLARLITDENPANSIDILEQAAEGSKDAAVWNDLAAARYVDATTFGHALQFPLALAAVRQAIALDPSSKEAHFNLALILERMGLPDKAREAWEKYLTLDPGSGWATEARQRLQRLAEPRAGVGFKEALERAKGDAVAIQALVRTFPNESRTRAEAVLPVEWAKAERAGDTARATERLVLARDLAAVLASVNGEHLAADSVRAIERADGASRTRLVGAYILYREARIDYQERRLSVAHQKFLRAEAVFREQGSAMAEWAAYYAAATLPDRNLIRDALRVLQFRANPRYRGLAAQVRWELAICASIAGDWGSLLRETEASSALFAGLNERTNAAAMDGLAAYALERIGATDLAWSRRIRALAGLTGPGEPRRYRTGLLQAAALALESNDHAGAAEAVMDLMIPDVPADEKSATLLSYALADRSRLASRAGDFATARRTLGESRAAALRIHEAGLRDTAVVQADLSGAALQHPDNPRASLAALDQAIRFFTSRRADALLAEAYLQRARVYRRAGDDVAADADYASAFDHVALQRRSLRDADVPLSFVNTATHILEERVDLQLSRGDVARAFEESERVHGLLLQDQPPRAAPAPIPHGVAVLKYVLLPQKMVVFCATSSGVTAGTVEVDRSEVTARIAAFNERLRQRVPVSELNVDGAALYGMLIAPVRAHLEGNEELVFIPDRQLHTVPFVALYDETRRKYLVDRFTIRFAVSLAGVAPVAAGALSPALVIADPKRPLDPALSSSRAEAEQIAAMWGATLVRGAEATRENFVAEVKDRALVHYAGHADSDVSEAYGALLLAPRGQDGGVFGTSDITRLELPRRPLVVLAGCGTARGEAVHLGGMSSIARAFLDAGARAVVGTLWEINDDVAASLFLEFHERLRQGAAPARALREVQSAMLHGTDAYLAHPASWAPVEVISNR